MYCKVSCFQDKQEPSLLFQNKNRPSVYTYDDSKKEKNTTQKEALAQKKIPKFATFLSSFCFCGNFEIFFSHPHILLSPKFARARKIFSPTRNISRAFSPKETRGKKSYQENKHKKGGSRQP